MTAPIKTKKPAAKKTQEAVVMTANPPMVPISQAESIVAVISRAASDPNVDIDKMERLLAMHERLVAVEASKAFSEAMGRLQNRIPVIKKKGRIAFRDENKKPIQYARYEDIEKEIRPHYNDEGFENFFTTETIEDGKIVVVLRVTHKQGHERITKSPPMPLDTSGAKDNIKAMGSTISYGKRYCLVNAYDVVCEGEDDDGTAGGKAAKEKDPFVDKMEKQSKAPPPQKAEDTQTVIQRAEALRKTLKMAANKAARQKLMGNSLPLVRELNEMGRSDVVASLHTIANQEDDNAATTQQN